MSNYSQRWMNKNISPLSAKATEGNLAEFRQFIRDAGANPETDPVLNQYCVKFVRELEHTQKSIGYHLAEIHHHKVDRLRQLDSLSKFDNGNDYFWITVNPKPSISLDVFTKVISRFITHKWIETYIYVLEVRKEDFSGLHLHLLAKRRNPSSKKWRVKQDLERSFGKVVSSATNNHLINLAQVSEEVAKDKLLYMLGNKSSKKAHSLAHTIAWRRDKTIPSYYTGTSTFPLLEVHTHDSVINIAPEMDATPSLHL